jgi:hypothetical protein
MEQPQQSWEQTTRPCRRRGAWLFGSLLAVLENMVKWARLCDTTDVRQRALRSGAQRTFLARAADERRTKKSPRRRTQVKLTFEYGGT